MVIGLIFFFKYDPAAYDTKGTGTIAEIDEYYETVGDDWELVHRVYIDYEAAGKKYEHVDYFEYNDRMKTGDTVTFYYMSEDPGQIAGSDKEYVPYYGLGFAIIGLIMLVVSLIKTIKRKNEEASSTPMNG